MMRQAFEPQDLEKAETLPPVQTEAIGVDAQAAPAKRAMIEGALHEAVKWRRRRRNALNFYGSLFLVSFIALFILPFVPRVAASPTAYLGITMMSLVGSLFGLIVAILMRPLRNNSINRLWASESAADVGPLLECTQMLLPEMSRKANAALVRLLPAMQNGDLVRLTSYQRECLRRLIDVGTVQEPSYANMTLEGTPAPYVEATRQRFQQLVQERKGTVLAVLRVFEQGGSELDLPVVAKLAAGKGIAGGDGEILAAANRCFESLQARCAQQRGSETFLRASEAPADAGNVLLRPARGIDITDPAQLLRPDVSEKPVN